ncbi:unnamed protein product [Linum trigynum]|uniref:Uncharacterized protein n=1 Tax=Linum trigynum TaxID=586398 RepID=A0AAV2D4A0_9ROSI
MEYTSKKLVFLVVLLVFAAGMTNIGAEEGSKASIQLVNPPVCKTPCQAPRCHCYFGGCICGRGPPPPTPSDCLAPPLISTSYDQKKKKQRREKNSCSDVDFVV